MTSLFKASSIFMSHRISFNHGIHFSNWTQFSSVTQSCPAVCNPWTAACQASLYIKNSRSLIEFMSIELAIPSNHLILCGPLLLLSSIFPKIRVSPNKLVLRMRWTKYWRFSINISPSNEHSGLISFRMDWSDQLAVQVTLKSLLQHHSSKASILPCSAFFIAHSHIHPWLLEKPQCLLDGPLLAKKWLCF